MPLRFSIVPPGGCRYTLPLTSRTLEPLTGLQTQGNVELETRFTSVRSQCFEQADEETRA